MKAGVLGVVDGSFDAINSVTETVTEDDHDLERCLVIDRVFSLSGGEVAFAGRGAADVLADRTRASIDGGEITVTDREETVTRHTEFVGVPGEFVVVGSGDGTFAFDLIGAETGTDVSRATVDLDGFFDRKDGATPWKAGFYGTGDDAVNGTVHGADLRTDYDLEAILEESTLNQLGLSHAYGDAQVKMTASRSGYVEVYRPTEFDSTSYLEYVLDEIIPHV
ncbi:hypothetical protein [Halorientalis halophila]|uniref:hypothetical protein n=1 Tax=Halorientalis halophila TaxID=3108499 RepID=UPI00300B557F